MAKKAIVECRVCKEKFNRLDPTLIEGEDWIKPVNLHYYHKKCYDDFVKKKGLIGEDGQIYITLCNVNITSNTTSSWYSFTKEKGYEYKVDLYVDNRIIRTENVPDVTYKPI